MELVKPILEPHEIEDMALQRIILSLSIFGPEAADRLMQRARTDKFQYEVAVDWIERQLQQGNPLPPGAIALVSDVMSRRLKPPEQRGQHTAVNIGRNVRICAAIKTLIDAGLSPTRNDASGPVSACDVVAEVLSPGQSKYQSVKSVWLKKGGHSITPAFKPD